MKSSEKTQKEIGLRFKNLRLQKGFTNYETFAVEYKLSRAHYWRIENGVTNMTIRSIVDILSIYDMSIEEFFQIKV